MTYGSIYKIRFPNGKHYIGLTTTSLEQRKNEHNSLAKKGDARILYNALRKHEMVDIFELEEIDKADTLDELCEKEIGYINQYNSHYIYGYGYNMTYGGEGTNGYVFTEENRQKIRNGLNKFYEENPEAGKENGKKLKQMYEDYPEARQKQSEILKRYYKDYPEARDEKSKKMKLYYEDYPEARDEMSKKRKQYFNDHPDLKQRMIESNKKRWTDPEVIRKQRERTKKHFENPEARKQMSERIKKRNADNPEWLKKSLDAKGQNKPFGVYKDEIMIGTFTYQFEAMKYLQTEYNITSYINISSVLSGKRKTSIGFVFKYI